MSQLVSYRRLANDVGSEKQEEQQRGEIMCGNDFAQNSRAEIQFSQPSDASTKTIRSLLHER